MLIQQRSPHTRARQLTKSKSAWKSYFRNFIGPLHRKFPHPGMMILLCVTSRYVTLCRPRLLPISCMSGADQWKFACQRPTFYHGATQPTKGSSNYFYFLYRLRLMYPRMSQVKVQNFLRASAMLKHVIDIGWTSVCLSVCPSVRHTLAPYQNGWIYCHAFFTTR